MQAAAFLQSLAAEKAPAVPPVILLVGPEAMLQRQVVRRLAGLLLPEGDEADIGLDRLDGGEAGMGLVLEAAAAGALFGDRRIVLVRNADKLSAPAGSAELAALERYLDSPNPSTILIFSAEAVNRGHQPFKLLAGRAEAVECEPLRGEPLRRWMAGHLRKRGYAFAPGAAALVEELLGRDLMTIGNALDKLMLYCGERLRIESEDVERSLGASREHAIWELTNAIGARDAAAAVNQLSRLLEGGKHPLQIGAALQYQFRRLLTVRSMLDRRLPEEEIIALAGLRFRPGQVIGQARAFSGGELRGIYRGLFDLEDGMKSSGVDARFLLEKSVLGICRSGGARSRRTRSRGGSGS